MKITPALPKTPQGLFEVNQGLLYVKSLRFQCRLSYGYVIICGKFARQIYMTRF